MDPTSVIRILWRHKLVTLPFLILTVAMFVGVLFFGPRAYQATSSVAMITPSLPTQLEIDANPDLGVATDNPYLRSADPTLVLQVGKTRLSSDDAIESLQAEGLSTDFVVGTGLSTSAQILTITANATDPEVAVASARRLGQILDEQIREVQLVNGASDRYLITVQTINEATGAAERISSRLRNAAVAGIGGIVLLIGAVAIARGIDDRRRGALAKTTPVASTNPEPKTQTMQRSSAQPPVRGPHHQGPLERPAHPQRAAPPIRRSTTVPPPMSGTQHPRLGGRPTPSSPSPRSK